MRIQRDGDDHDIRTLIEHGSSSWAGPSPSASRARWAAEPGPRRRVTAGLAAAGFGVAALVGGSLVFVATSRSPAGPAASVVHLVSHVFPQPPSPSAQPSASAPPAAAQTPPAPPAAAGPARTPSPSPTRSGDDDRRPSPSPSPSASPAPGPSPSPSRPPNE